MNQVSLFRDAYDEFRREGVEVATISVDSPYAHRVWARDLAVPYPMISDFNRDLMERYGIPDANMRLLPRVTSRAAFVIDGGCIVRYIWYRSENGEGVPLAEILEAAGALPGDCPSGEG